MVGSALELAGGQGGVHLSDALQDRAWSPGQKWERCGSLTPSNCLDCKGLRSNACTSWWRGPYTTAER